MQMARREMAKKKKFVVSSSLPRRSYLCLKNYYWHVLRIELVTARKMNVYSSCNFVLTDDAMRIIYFQLEINWKKVKTKRGGSYDPSMDERLNIIVLQSNIISSEKLEYFEYPAT